jgi:hypothetical protein
VEILVNGETIFAKSAFVLDRVESKLQITVEDFSADKFFTGE